MYAHYVAKHFQSSFVNGSYFSFHFINVESVNASFTVFFVISTLNKILLPLNLVFCMHKDQTQRAWIKLLFVCFFTLKYLYL